MYITFVSAILGRQEFLEAMCGECEYETMIGMTNGDNDMKLKRAVEF